MSAALMSSWYEDFVFALTNPVPLCTCGHNTDSHWGGFSSSACIWCDCRNAETLDSP